MRLAIKKATKLHLGKMSALVQTNNLLRTYALHGLK